MALTEAQKRQLVADSYKIILGRNKYSQDAAKRECCFTPYKDGKYYSDCSSSIRLAYKRANIGLNNIGGNTVAMYQKAALKTVACGIKSGVPTDVAALRVGDMLLFAGNDSSRSYADYVGHVELIYKISGSTVTLCGHGSGTPSTKNMVTYCKQRQSTKASTKKGNRGLLKVVRAIPDDTTQPTGGDEPMAVNSDKIKVTGASVNLRTGPGTEYAVYDTVKAGKVLEHANPDGWYPVKIGDRIVWISPKMSEKV